MSNMVIQTNMLSLNAHRNMGITGADQARASARLSSGFRINTAADDAAGLGISEKMRGQIRSLNQASRNAQDGISLIQTAEGAMQTVNDLIIRTRELIVQAANDTNVHDDAEVAHSDRARIQDEVNQLLDEIDQIAWRTEFNTRTLLNGDWSREGSGVTLSAAGTALANGAVAQFQSFVAVQIGHILSTSAGGAPAATGIGELIDDMVGSGFNADHATTVRNELVALTTRFQTDVLSAGSLAEVEQAEQNFANALRDYRIRLENRHSAELGTLVTGASQLQVDFAALLDAIYDNSAYPATPPANASFANMGGGFEHLADGVGGGAAAQQFADPADTRGITNAEGLAATVFDRFSGGRSLWFHIGANQNQGVRLHIENVSVEALGIGHLRNVTAGNVLLGGDVMPGPTGHPGIMRESGEEIGSDNTAFLESLDNAMSVVNQQRSTLGAMQNRLEFTTENLDIAAENLQASNSRIRDADMAREMMRFTQTNVLQQAAISMLAQANQQPQNILQLLR